MGLYEQKKNYDKKNKKSRLNLASKQNTINEKKNSLLWVLGKIKISRTLYL